MTRHDIINHMQDFMRIQYIVDDAYMDCGDVFHMLFNGYLFKNRLPLVSRKRNDYALKKLKFKRSPDKTAILSLMRRKPGNLFLSYLADRIERNMPAVPFRQIMTEYDSWLLAWALRQKEPESRTGYKKLMKEYGYSLDTRGSSL